MTMSNAFQAMASNLEPKMFYLRHSKKSMTGKGSRQQPVELSNLPNHVGGFATTNGMAMRELTKKKENSEDI